MSPTGHRFAARSGKTALYKFRPYRTAEDKQRVHEIIVEHRIYFARGSQLNDPFDLTPVLKLTRDRGRLLADAERTWARSQEHPPEYRARQRQRLATSDLAMIQHEGEQRARARVERDYWVFSLAGNRDHPMLWSHYAAGHTGLCIHFACKGNSPFCGAQRVSYVAARPVLRVPITESDQDVGDLLTLRKGQFWKYEEEYRFVRYPDTPFDDVGLGFDGQHASFSPHVLTGITLGARMPAEDMVAIQKLAADHRPALPVWQAEEQRTYRLGFRPLPPYTSITAG